MGIIKQADFKKIDLTRETIACNMIKTRNIGVLITIEGTEEQEKELFEKVMEFVLKMRNTQIRKVKYVDTNEGGF